MVVERTALRSTIGVQLCACCLGAPERLCEACVAQQPKELNYELAVFFMRHTSTCVVVLLNGLTHTRNWVRDGRRLRMRHLGEDCVVGVGEYCVIWVRTALWVRTASPG